MVRSSATTVTAYLASLPKERAAVIKAVRAVIKKNLPKGYVEVMNWGMISYEIPLKTYHITYNKQPLPYAGLAAQKNNYSLYLMGLYWKKDTEEWFRNEFKKRKLKLEKGKGCIRFNKLDDLALDVVGEVIGMISVKDYIKHY
ncbi:MAG: DUF1801 domain-containing protein [archaeon]